MSSISTENKSSFRVFIRILRLPPSKLVEGIDVSRFKPGQTYDVGPHLAELLIETGCAKLERRKTEHRSSES